jgi:(E)-4-hydroxy-3-methylbut-2-enyl-diphosphate synthase
MKVAAEIKERTRHLKGPLKIAIMGCAVNGPGEARDADIGVAGGDGEGLIFVKGQVIRKVGEEALADSLMDEIEKILEK